jgi:VCBS repeat protein
VLNNGDGTIGNTNRSYYVGGYQSFSVAIGDLNGDSKPDLAVANAYPSNTVSVLLGKGDGTFGARSDYPIAGGPVSAAVADLNGDGNADLAVVNNSGPVSVLLGNGDGTFGAKSDYGTGSSPFSIVIGDLNGDGRLDLAVAYRGSNTVSVLLGNGDGTFGAQSDYGTGDGPRSVAIGDLNGDGRLDLASANFGSYPNFGSTVSVLLGNGDGTFGPRSDYGTGSGPASVAIGDLNGDGRPDLAVANFFSSTTSVLLGNGDGTFGPKSDSGTGRSPASVAIGDLNGDGRPDLAVATSFLVSVLLGHGDGTFGASIGYVSGGNGSTSVAIGDLNGDARSDLAVANLGGGPNFANWVSVLINTGGGTKSPKLTVSLSPSLLCPPNHELVIVHATVVAEDANDPAPQVTLISITSDEPDDGTSSEDVPHDIQDAEVGTADYDFELRAERAEEGDGRTYTVCYEARDASGNSRRVCDVVNVPHDRCARPTLADSPL